jgi:hypothetical protein
VSEYVSPVRFADTAVQIGRLTRLVQEILERFAILSKILKNFLNSNKNVEKQGNKAQQVLLGIGADLDRIDKFDGFAQSIVSSYRIKMSSNASENLMRWNRLDENEYPHWQF